VWLGLVAALLAGGLAVLIARTASTGGPQNSRPSLQRVIDGLVTGPGRIAPGVTAYVAGPRGVWVGSAGIAVIGTPMTPDARLRLNSVGKTWTATLILKLVAEGRMKVDDTVSHWLPGLLPYGNRVTIEQLLSMTSGMVDTNDFEAKPAYYINRITDPVVREHVLAAARRARTDPTYRPTRVWIEAAAGQPPLYRPGSAWHYSNIGYMVLGLVAARVGGADLATLFRTRIMDPLHLQSARYDPAPKIRGPPSCSPCARAGSTKPSEPTACRACASAGTFASRARCSKRGCASGRRGNQPAALRRIASLRRPPVMVREGLRRGTRPREALRRWLGRGGGDSGRWFGRANDPSTSGPERARPC
jgi:CubicO group peptidase (beta-lactamase class C family)